jgi:Holliday junction resolvase RusA-like endonuclease
MDNVLFSATIPGRCYIKKNGQRTVGFGKSKHVIYSPKYLAWSKDAIILCRKAFSGETIRENIEGHYKFYFKNHEHEADTSNLTEGPGDILKTAGVISDDKIIKRIIAEKFFGEEPRTEIVLRKIG